MHPSKKLLNLAVLGICLLGFGCTKPEKQDPSSAEGRNADFKVHTGLVQGWEDPVLANDPWQKPFSTTFQFTACLRDRAHDTQLPNQTGFLVEDPVTHERMQVSDGTTDQGCLVWNEPIPFNYFVSRSRWVTIERDIIGTGVHVGRRRVTYAINPWKASGRKEINPSKSGYFLRDEPLELKRPADRVKKIYDFFRDTLLREVGIKVASSSEQLILDAWQNTLREGSQQNLSLLAPVADSNAALAGSDEGNAEIWVSEVKTLNQKKQNIAVTDEGPDGERGYIVQQTLTMNPRLRIRHANGAEDFEDIVKGDFDIFAQVVATDTGFDKQDKKLILSESLNRLNALDPAHPSSPDGVGRIVDGHLIAFVTFKVNRRVSEGNADLVLRLMPKRIGNRAPKPFEGIFNMGKVNNWVGSSITATIDRSCVPGLQGLGLCNYENYLSKTSNFAAMKTLHEATAAEPYQFANIKARFVQIDTGEVSEDSSGALRVNTGETATQRTVLYSASTCVTDITGERLARQKFVIRYLEGSESSGNYKPIEKVSDDSGCILWTNTVNHGYYKPEKFFRQVISIEGPGGAKRIKTVYLNPWDDKFTFGFDEEELGREYFERSAKRPRIPSRFYMGDYAYHTVRFLYEIDPYMDLEVKKTVLMDLHPQVLRYSGIISGRKVTEYLRDGIYMLKVAIQKSYLDPADRFRRLCEVDRARSVKDENGREVEDWERVTISDPELCKLTREQRQVSLNDQSRGASQQHQPMNASLAKFEDTVAAKDFIATKTTLVRVTDGLIIQPVELSMKDLRLMRIRSNFLIQLEAVDERKVLANDQLSQAYRKFTSDILQERRNAAEQFRARTAAQPDEAQITRDRQARDRLIVQDAAAKRDYIRELYQRELSRLDQHGNVVTDFNRAPGQLQKLLRQFETIRNPGDELKNIDPAPRGRKSQTF